MKFIAKGKSDVQQKWLQYANACIKPAIYTVDYYSEHLKADLMSGPLSAFKAARLFSPLNIHKTKPKCTALSSLLASSFITESLLAALKEEFPQYVALAEDVSPDYNIIKFWKTYSDAIPNWGKAASKVFLAQPTSAAAERVFSIMNNNLEISKIVP